MKNIMYKFVRLSLPLVFIFAIGLAGCATVAPVTQPVSTPVSIATPTPSPTPTPAPIPALPTLIITAPKSGATLQPGNVVVTIQANNFNLIDKLGQANVAGQGHIHYFMDVTVPTTPGQPAVTGPGTYAATAATSYTWSNVTPGTHTFSAELINNDHTPLVPPVVATVTVTVQAPVTPTLP